MSVRLFMRISFESNKKQCEENHKRTRNWHANHMGIQLQVSNYHSNWVPVIGHPCDHVPITWQIGTQRTNQNKKLGLNLPGKFSFFSDYNWKRACLKQEMAKWWNSEMTKWRNRAKDTSQSCSKITVPLKLKLLFH